MKVEVDKMQVLLVNDFVCRGKIARGALINTFSPISILISIKNLLIGEPQINTFNNILIINI